MQQGTVRCFNAAKGYGFVVPDGGCEDVFLHYSKIRMRGYRTVETGARVEFEIESSPKGPQAETQKLHNYLGHVQQEKLISAATAELARYAWSALSAATHNAIEPPDACPGDDGLLLLTWDRGDHHLELEFVPDETPTFFYCHRKQQQDAWERSWNRGAGFDSQVLTVVRYFSGA